MYYHLLVNSETDFNMLSDNEKTVITSFRKNIPVGDRRNPTNHPINDAWQVWEGDYTNERKKHAPTTTNDRRILNKVTSKTNIAAVAFMTGGYKKALQEYTKKFKKGTSKHTGALSFNMFGFKRYIINNDGMLNDFLRRANPYGVPGFGFGRIEKFVNESEYYLPSEKMTEYYAAEGLTRLKRNSYEYNEYYTPLCAGFLTWDDYHHTGYMVMDYMPEYLNMDAWTSIFKGIVKNFFKRKPDSGLLFNPAEEFERDYCMKMGFVPADLDPKHEMSEYILYSKNLRNAD